MSRITWLPGINRLSWVLRYCRVRRLLRWIDRLSRLAGIWLPGIWLPGNWLPRILRLPRLRWIDGLPGLSWLDGLTWILRLRLSGLSRIRLLRKIRRLIRIALRRRHPGRQLGGVQNTIARPPRSHVESGRLLRGIAG